jgi:hypothetical protein
LKLCFRAQGVVVEWVGGDVSVSTQRREVNILTVTEAAGRGRGGRSITERAPAHRAWAHGMEILNRKKAKKSQPARQAGRQPASQSCREAPGDWATRQSQSTAPTRQHRSSGQRGRRGVVADWFGGGAKRRGRPRARRGIADMGAGWGVGRCVGRTAWPFDLCRGPAPTRALTSTTCPVRFGRFGTQTPQIQAGRPAGVFLLPPRPGGGGWMGGWAPAAVSFDRS